MGRKKEGEDGRRRSGLDGCWSQGAVSASLSSVTSPWRVTVRGRMKCDEMRITAIIWEMGNREMGMGMGWLWGVECCSSGSCVT